MELKVPYVADFSAFDDKFVGVFVSYILSFVNIGIYWNNHHHMLQATRHITGKVLWANMNLLFWLSLIPFTTTWMGENHFAPLPVALYGLVLVFAAIAYVILQNTLIKDDDAENSLLAEAIGGDLKGKLSIAIYVTAIPLAFVNRWISCALYVLVAIIWFIPDRRIEKKIHN